MADPVTLIGVGAIVLAEGIRFCYDQAGELLTGWRERRTARRAAETEAVTVTTPDALGGKTFQADVDPALVDQIAEPLARVRGRLANVGDGTLDADLSDQQLLSDFCTARELLEQVYGVRLTLTGEPAMATGTPVVRSHLQIERLTGRAHATGADIDEMNGPATVDTGITVGTADGDSRLEGVHVKRMGPSRREP
ncbi:hypothetical protein AR457_40485 [Streptomyces agglomeratus]|uniref:hypothetical protein n=1 Tax=Streptomyces agglomeratus TaxID=285458 RepID=UPI0008528A5F|nr:hypothetical protein [Streptomyces agglomeratus]OEJ22155.1 hypothetical protein AR457_40485 [Streptomyces agglomeratus]OEJ36993.1 hypothetical protein BGK70_01140 [Streptomyces agglomeratus]